MRIYHTVFFFRMLVIMILRPRLAQGLNKLKSLD
jgi:hypothetical protein